MKCPNCGAELEITDKWIPGLWMVRCPRYACDLPFYVQGREQEVVLKAFLDAAESWRNDNRLTKEQLENVWDSGYVKSEVEDWYEEGD